MRDAGMAVADANAGDDWKEAADAVIRALAASGAEFSAEDVRLWVGEPPTPNAMGARFMAARKKGILELLGYRQASRASAHARALAVYRGAQR